MIPAAKLDDAFPVITPGEKPCGPRILVQLPIIIEKTASGIVLPQDTRDANRSMSQIGLLVDKGTLAFCNRSTGEPWHEGVWACVGDLVRIPRYQVDGRFERTLPSGNKVVFVIIEDHMVKSVIDPEAFEDINQLI